MSLIVYPYKRDPFAGKMEDLTKDSQSAGFEAWRGQVWGSEMVRSLRCRLLPSLEKGDIYAEGADLDQLEAEASLLLQHVELLAARTGIMEYRVPKRDEGPEPDIDIRVQTGDKERATSLGWRKQEGENSLRDRLRNILAAVRTARELGEGHGGGYIG
jgi:hypothetical protein